MIPALITIVLAFLWLGYESDWLRVRLPVGPEPQPAPDLERIDFETCKSRYGTKQLQFSPGIDEPLCGWEWLQNNTHPVPRVAVSFSSGGVRYHWNIKDCDILKDALTATHAKVKPLNGHLKFKRNKLGGLVAPLPAKPR